MLARLDKSDVLHGDIIQFAADMRAAAIKRIPVVLSMKTLVTKMLDQTGCCLAPIFDGEIEYGLATPSAVIHADVPVNRKGTLTAIFKCGTSYVRGAYYREFVCMCVFGTSSCALCDVVCIGYAAQATRPHGFPRRSMRWQVDGIRCRVGHPRPSHDLAVETTGEACLH